MTNRKRFQMPLAGMVAAVPQMVVVTKITVAVTRSIMIRQNFVHQLSSATVK